MFLFCDTFRVIEMKLKEACEKLKSLQKPKSASEYSDDDDDIFFDLGMARLNLCSCIENLEWKVDLKLLYTIKNS